MGCWLRYSIELTGMRGQKIRVRIASIHAVEPIVGTPGETEYTYVAFGNNGHFKCLETYEQVNALLDQGHNIKE